MEKITTHWTHDEFKAYILLYAATCNYIENPQEKQFILSRVDKEVYKNIRHELDADNDYQSIQKVISTLERLSYSEEELQKLTTEIMDLFLADKEFDATERNIFMMLKRFLKK